MEYTPVDGDIIILASTMARIRINGQDFNVYPDQLMSMLMESDEHGKMMTAAFAQSVIDLFNLVMGKKRGIELNDYRKRTILARVREGRKMKPKIGLEQFKAVFEFKRKQVETDPEAFQEKWLTIETLCSAKHFLKYLDEARESYRKSLNSKPERAFKLD